jgi:hypothetical protein
LDSGGTNCIYPKHSLLLIIKSVVNRSEVTNKTNEVLELSKNLND